MRSLLLMLLVAEPALAYDGRVVPRVERLVTAAYEGDLEGVRAALKAGANVDGRASHGDVAIIEAAREGHADVVKLLIKHGADDTLAIPVPTKDAFGAAAATGHLDVLKVLFGRYQVVDWREDPWRWHLVVSFAAAGRHKDIIAFAKKSGYDLTSQGGHGFKDDRNPSTALHLCAERGDETCVDVLLGLEVNPLLRDISGKRASELVPNMPELRKKLAAAEDAFIAAHGDVPIDYLKEPPFIRWYEEKDPAVLRVLKNTIYARHGHSFKSEDLRAHFAAQPWYKERPGYQVPLQALRMEEKWLIESLDRAMKAAAR